MFYNQDDEENFLSDKRVEEVYQEEPVTTRINTCWILNI